MTTISILAGLLFWPVFAFNQQVLPFLTKDHKYRFVNDDVQFVSKLQYDWVYMHSTKGYWHARRSDSSMVIGPDGREVYKTKHRIEPLYNYNDRVYIRTKNSSYYGLADLLSGKDIPEEWDDIYHYQEGDPVLVKKNNKLGLRTLDNRELMPARFDYLRLFNGNFVLYYQDKQPVIANFYSGDTLHLNFPEPVQNPEFSNHWIQFKGKQQSYISSFAMLAQKTPLITGEKFIYWTNEHVLVIKNGQAALIDTGHLIVQQYPVTLKAPYQCRNMNNALIFYNGDKSIYIDLAGNVDSIPLPAGQLADEGEGYIISPSDPTGFHYTLRDKRIVLQKYRKNMQLLTARLELKGTRFSVYNNKNKQVYTADSVTYFSTADSIHVDITCNNGKIYYDLRSGKTMPYTTGYFIPVKIGEQYFCRYNRGDLYIYYDAGFNEVKRIQSNETPRLFGRFIGEKQDNKFHISDFFTGQQLPVTASGSNVVMNNELPYILIFDTYNYYINRNGIVLKEEK